MTPPHVVFDFDGTLADSLASAVAVFERLRPALGLRPVPDLEAARAMPTRQLLKALGVRFWRLPRVVRAFQVEAAKDAAGLKLHAGIADVLGELAGRGHRLGVLSSNRADSIRACLRANGVEDRFAFVVGTGKLFGKGKALKAILKAEGVPDGACVYVGDEARDVDAGRRCGVPVAAALWGFQTEGLLAAAGPRWLVRHPRELLAVAEELRRGSVPASGGRGSPE